MNNLQHIPLDEILLMSFQAADEGEIELSEKLYESFISTKDKALQLAEKASINGDLDTLDIISKSIEKAKLVSKSRTSMGNNKLSGKELNNGFDDNFLDLDNNKSNQNNVNVNDLAKNIISEFQKSQNNELTENEIENFENYNLDAASFKDAKFSDDKLLRKYLREENYEAGVRRSSKLLEKDTNSSFLNNYLGYCLKNLNKVEEARKAFSKALTIQKDAPEIIYNDAKLDLKLGNFNIGWENYDAGLKFNLRKVFDGFLLNEKPIWDGKPFKGCLLIYGEQTISDQLIFSTVIEDLLKVHQNVALVINKGLKKIFQRTYKNLTIFGDDEDLSNFDYAKHIPIGSLCKYFRDEVKKFDNCTEKFLITSPEIDNQVKIHFPKTDGLKIGVSWKDFDLIKNSTKYLSNSDVSEVIKFGNNTFINLQFGDVSSDLMQINGKSSNEIHHIPGINYSENIESYSSIIKNCDLIISIDNMTAHLAARLGKPVWVLLSSNCDYKWLEKKESSIWYKNVLLLRQTEKNDWSKIIGYINSALK